MRFRFRRIVLDYLNPPLQRRTQYDSGIDGSSVFQIVPVGLLTKGISPFNIACVRNGISQDMLQPVVLRIPVKQPLKGGGTAGLEIFDQYKIFYIFG